MSKNAPETPMNIYQKLAKIRKAVEVIQKNKSGYGYKYVSEDEILAKVTVYMDRYNLSLLPGIVPGTTVVAPYLTKKTKFTKSGQPYEENVNDIIVSADMTWTWVNNDNPEERVEIPWSLVGQQADAAQALGSGLTYSDRYFLLKYFNIATPDDDPDNFRAKQKNAESEESAMIAAGIASSIDLHLKTYLSDRPDDREAVAKVVKKYVKSGDYTKIVEPALATKLYKEIQETFPVKADEE